MQKLSYVICVKYPELWKWFNEFSCWPEIDEIIGYDGEGSSMSFDEYVSQNEHLHEEWIMKMKMKLL